MGTTQIGKSPAMPPPIWKKPMDESFDTWRYQDASSIMYSIPERTGCTLLIAPVMQRGICPAGREQRKILVSSGDHPTIGWIDLVKLFEAALTQDFVKELVGKL